MTTVDCQEGRLCAEFGSGLSESSHNTAHPLPSHSGAHQSYSSAPLLRDPHPATTSRFQPLYLSTNAAAL